MEREKIKISTALADPKLAIKEADDKFRVVSFFDYDPVFDNQIGTAEPVHNPFKPEEECPA